MLYRFKSLNRAQVNIPERGPSNLRPVEVRPERSAANRFGRIVWFSARQLFQASTPSLSRARCSLFAIAYGSFAWL